MSRITDAHDNAKAFLKKMRAEKGESPGYSPIGHKHPLPEHTHKELSPKGHKHPEIMQKAEKIHTHPENAAKNHVHREILQKADKIHEHDEYAHKSQLQHDHPEYENAEVDLTEVKESVRDVALSLKGKADNLHVKNHLMGSDQLPLASPKNRGLMSAAHVKALNLAVMGGKGGPSKLVGGTAPALIDLAAPGPIGGNTASTAEFTGITVNGVPYNTTNVGPLNSSYGQIIAIGAGGNFTNTPYGNDCDGTVSIGYGACSSATLRYSANVVAIGRSAGADLTNGGGNVLIGAYSGAQMTNSSSNIALGYSALSSITATSTESGAYGYDGAIGIGNRAGVRQTDAFASISIGPYSAYSVTGKNTGSIAIGWYADHSSASPSYEIVIGQGQTGRGDYTTIIGGGANTAVYLVGDAYADAYMMEPNTEGGLYVGTRPAGISTSQGVLNTVVGLDCGSALTTGFENTFVGESAGESMATGWATTFVGSKAGQAAVSVANCTAVGHHSYMLGTGSSVTAYGAFSGAAATSGCTYMCAIGGSALNSLTAGQKATALGHGAGSYYGVTGGYTAMSSSSHSIFIGTYAAANANGETDQIVIGSDATGNGSYTTTIGNDNTQRTFLEGALVHPTTPDELTAAGAISLVTPITHISSAGGAYTVTLADGVQGQRKMLICTGYTADITITPTNLQLYTSLVMVIEGSNIELLFTNGYWCVIGVGKALVGTV